MNTKLTIASWNVMSGGFEKRDATHDEPERLNFLQKGILTIGADVVGLVDTHHWDKIFSHKDLQAMFGYQYAYCVNLEDIRLKRIGHNNGLTFLSNLPVEEVKTIWLGTRNAIRARVTLGSNSVIIYVVYFDDLSEDTRLSQASLLLEDSNNLDIPIIIMGDLNSFDPHDTYLSEKGLEIVSSVLPNDHADWQRLQEMRKATTLPLLYSHGFMRAEESHRATIPTPLMGVPVDGPLFKLDYILINRSLRVVEAKVWQSDLYDKASDHYPISAVIELT